MKSKAQVTHVHAVCDDCSAEFIDQQVGQAHAARHAKLYGHRVPVEVTLWMVYDYREKDPADESSIS